MHIRSGRLSQAGSLGLDHGAFTQLFPRSQRTSPVMRRIEGKGQGLWGYAFQWQVISLGCRDGSGCSSYLWVTFINLYFMWGQTSFLPVLPIWHRKDLHGMKKKMNNNNVSCFLVSYFWVMGRARRKGRVKEKEKKNDRCLVSIMTSLMRFCRNRPFFPFSLSKLVLSYMKIKSFGKWCT